MSARDKYISVFGKIETLEAPVTWTTGISNMLEWLLWETSHVLGISKTKYRNLIAEKAYQAATEGKSLEETKKEIASAITGEMNSNEHHGRFDKYKTSIASPREALRRSKFFSEDYLNKEFDIFWALASDTYLDEFYGRLTSIQGGGEWFSHGNSGLFAYSVQIDEMQMDNVSYNPGEKLLVANELKLGGQKNKDQMLKYAYMFNQLREKRFIAPDTRFVVLFIGDKREPISPERSISAEIDHCGRSLKSTHAKIVEQSCIDVALATEYYSLSWSDLISFNNFYKTSLELPTQQVEHKLITGFNETLHSKAFLNR